MYQLELQYYPMIHASTCSSKLVIKCNINKDRHCGLNKVTMSFHFFQKTTY